MHWLTMERSTAKKGRKQASERRRRERINQSLEEIKQLICKNNLLNEKKMDKADILELAVNFLRRNNNQQSSVAIESRQTGTIDGDNKATHVMQKDTITENTQDDDTCSCKLKDKVATNSLDINDINSKEHIVNRRIPLEYDEQSEEITTKHFANRMPTEMRDISERYTNEESLDTMDNLHKTNGAVCRTKSMQYIVLYLPIDSHTKYATRSAAHSRITPDENAIERPENRFAKQSENVGHGEHESVLIASDDDKITSDTIWRPW
ncbi:unnamed protein product [Owenia fusiformis]|uniref:Uncharacterized protein n=1 Tax=Owenia fusiformis TaxID=6347 RepID=A0A8J1TPP1_OWEFU|nr:unnamed protein product [Owenia fusiformis]